MFQKSSYIYRLRQSSFVANLATLSAGSIIAQIIPFIATVIISRLYSPEDMGIWGVFSSYASILIMVGTLRYDGAIVRAKNNQDAYCLTNIAIILSLISTVVFYLAAFIIHIFDINIGMSGGIIYILPLYTLTLLLVQSFTNLSTFLRKYKLISFNSVGLSLSQSGSRIILGLLKFNRLGMILGAIIGNIISVFTFLICLKGGKEKKKFNFNRHKALFKENIDFPKYDLPGNLLNSVSSHCPPILLALYFSDSVVGLFSMAQTLLFVPMSFVGTSVSQLYYKDASEAYNQGHTISELTRRLFLALFSLSAFFMCVLILCEGWLFGLVLGSKWNDVGQYAVLLSPWLLLVSTLTPLSPIFSIKGKLNINMNLNLIGLVIRVVSILLVAQLFHSSMFTILAFGMSSALFFVVQGYYILKFGELYLYKRDRLVLVAITTLFLITYIWKVTSIFTGA